MAGFGRDSCPAEGCYDPSFAIPVPLQTQRAKCCLPRQTRVPTVVGGKFAIATKNLESLSEANAM